MKDDNTFGGLDWTPRVLIILLLWWWRWFGFVCSVVFVVLFVCLYILVSGFCFVFLFFLEGGGGGALLFACS